MPVRETLTLTPIPRVSVCARVCVQLANGSIISLRLGAVPLVSPLSPDHFNTVPSISLPLSLSLPRSLCLMKAPRRRFGAFLLLTSYDGEHTHEMPQECFWPTNL